MSQKTNFGPKYENKAIYKYKTIKQFKNHTIITNLKKNNLKTRKLINKKLAINKIWHLDILTKEQLKKRTNVIFSLIAY